MRFFPRVPRPLLCGAIFALATVSSHALTLTGGDINTSAPASNTFNGTTFSSALPWDYVWEVGDSSGVYLGDIGNNGTYWILTAGHVASSLPSTVTFGSTVYNTVSGSYHQLHNTDANGTLTDLALFAVDISSAPVGLSALSLSSSNPVTGADIYYIGYGGHVKRWGFNDVEFGLVNIDDGFATAQTFFSDYDSGSSNPNEAQAIQYDSGGGAFIYNTQTGQWQLAGIMLAVGSSPVATYSANLANYRPEILSIVPEPSTLTLFALGAAAFGSWRRRRA